MSLFKIQLITLIFSLIFLGFASCGSEEKNDRPRPDVSKLKAEIKIHRFEQDLFALDTTKLLEELPKLGAKYPEMLPLFAGNIIKDQTNPSEKAEDALTGFVKSPIIRRLNDSCQLAYPNLDFLEKDLSTLFAHYQYYFPKKSVPKVVTMISEYATDAFTAGDELCGIGLDMFLGENYKGYNPDIFPIYLTRQFRQEYMKVRLAKALAQNAGESMGGKTLLDWMLYNGKNLYVTSCLLPETPDSVIMGYTTEQILGCQFNEQEAWAAVMDKQLLYSTEFDKWRKMVNPSPNAPVLFAEAPGDIGSWLGWQIVKSYMKRNPKTTFSDLLHLSDSQKFLEMARYKPVKR